MSKFRQQLANLKILRPAVVALIVLLSPVLPGQVNIAHAQLAEWAVDSAAQAFVKAVQYLMHMAFRTAALLVAQIGFLLDYVVEWLVLDMATMINDIGAIDTLWATFRDLGNIVFIGVLLYIAIRTILNVGNNFNTKKIMVRLVVVALLVNFSLFATKVVVDTSNVIALQFYNNIQVEDCGEGVDCNISHFFADAVSVSSVLSPSVVENADSEDKSTFRVFVGTVMGIVFLLVTGFVMAAMAFLLIVRFGFLILLMIASPLAFIAFILPSMSKHGEKWWNALLSQSFFAPVLFAMVYVVAALAVHLRGISGEDRDLIEAFLDPDGDSIGAILVFILITFLMAYTLVIAKQMGAAGASHTVKIGKQARNWGQTKVVGGTVGAAAGATAWAGRQSIGRGSQSLSESQKLKDKAAGSGLGAWAARQTLNLSDKTAQRSFDARNTKAGSGISGPGQREGGFREVIEDKKKKREEEKKLIESLSPAEQAKVERAKMKKEQADKSLEKREKEIKLDEKQVKTTYEDRKESNQSEYESEMNDIQASEEQTKSELQEIKTDLDKVSSAVQKRDELGDRLEEARSAGDRRMVERITARIETLTDDIDGVDNIAELDQKETQLQERQNNLRDRQNELQERKKETKETYSVRKKDIRERYVSDRDQLKQSRQAAKEATKKFKKKMDVVADIGKRRGEAFVETMLEQESMLDKLIGDSTLSPTRGLILDGTTQTQANRQFSLDNVGDINPKGGEDDSGKTRQQRVSSMLRKSQS